MGTRRKHGLDGPLTALGYVCLALSAYFLLLGLGTLFGFNDSTDLADAVPGPGAETYWTVSTVVSIVVLIGLSFALAATDTPSSSSAAHAIPAGSSRAGPSISWSVTEERALTTVAQGCVGAEVRRAYRGSMVERS